MITRNNLHIRDPYVFVQNGVYYVLGTHNGIAWNNGKGLLMHKSKDLELFETEHILIADSDFPTYKDIWAPELHKYKNRYYLIISVFREDLGRGSIIYTSDRLDGEFTALTGQYITPIGWGCLDATLFVYGGKPYLCFSNEWTTPITADGDGSLFMVELTYDLTSRIGRPKKIVSGKYSGIAVNLEMGAGGYVAEAPWLYGENGNIVLLWSTIGKNGYTVVKSISKSGVFGEYITDKVLFARDGGHCMCFTDLYGEDWITLHQPNNSPHERMQLYKYSDLR